MRWQHIGVLSVLVSLSCTADADAESRLEAIRQAYSSAIKIDFIAGLHGKDVAGVLKALDTFEGPDELRHEARAFAERIRRTQARNPMKESQLAGRELFGAEVKEALPQLASADPTEAIWMKALQVGAFRADFERYWLGCFQPVGGEPDRWQILDVPPCRRRPGLDRIAEVRFKGGQISALVTHEQILSANQAKP